MNAPAARPKLGHELDPDGRNLYELAAGCLYEPDRADHHANGCTLLELKLDDAGRPHGCDVWLRSWTPKGYWHDDDSRYAGSRSGRLTLSFNARAPTAGSVDVEVDDGAELLARLGVQGTLTERQGTSSIYRGHALALSSPATAIVSRPFRTSRSAGSTGLNSIRSSTTVTSKETPGLIPALLRTGSDITRCPAESTVAVSWLMVGF
jgi:hypothetical protein